jgi:hypothetical protein
MFHRLYGSQVVCYVLYQFVHRVPGNFCQFVGTDLLCAGYGSAAADGGLGAALESGLMD